MTLTQRNNKNISGAALPEYKGTLGLDTVNFGNVETNTDTKIKMKQPPSSRDIRTPAE